MRRGLLASRDELKSLSSRMARKPFDSIYDMLRKRCALTLEAPPVTEARWRLLWEQGGASAALKAARTTQGRILDLLIAHHIESNSAYRDRAIEELKNLASWSTWCDPAHADTGVDLCTAEAAVAAVVGLDWLYEDLSEVDRLRVLHAIRNRVIQPYRQAVAKKAWWHSVYHSWNAVINSGCGLAALALADDEHAAVEAYQFARNGLKHFFDAMGREGGWDEGIGPWGYAMRYILLLAEAAGRTTDDMGILHTRGMDATGLFPIYFTPNGQYAGFGDSPAVPLYGALYLLVKHFGQKELTWWLDQYAFHRDVSTTDWSAAGLAMLFRPVDAESPPAVELPSVRVFNEIGWAAIADHWPKPAFYVSAKTGDLSAYRSQRDMCSINVQVDGEMLLADAGLPPYSVQSADQPHGEFMDLQAANHNTVIVGSRDHRIDAQGTLVEAQAAHEYRWLACDGGTACGETTHFVRHLIMLCNPKSHAGHTLMVLDEIAGPTAERADVFWHVTGEVAHNLMTSGGTITGRRASLHYLLASTNDMHASVLSREAPHRKEQILHISSPASTRNLILSIFSREAIRGKVQIKRTAAGDTKIKVGSLEMHFKAFKKHLQLTELTAL